MRSIRSEPVSSVLRRRGAAAHGERGVALVAVLWMAAILTMLVSSMAYTVRVDTQVASGHYDQARVTALLNGALRLAASDIALNQAADWRRAALTYEIDGIPVTVEVLVSSGFININAASDTLLQSLFQYGAGLPEDQAMRMAHRVIDWRDADDEPELMGAEIDAYLAAGLAYGPRNGPFQRPDDLLQVLGLSLPVYDSIHKLVTTIGMGEQINPIAAPARVLAVLGKGDQSLAQQIIDARTAGQDIASLSSGLGDSLDESASADYRLRAMMPAEAGKKWQRVVWLSVGGSGGTQRREQNYPWTWRYAEQVSTMTDSSLND